METRSIGSLHVSVVGLGCNNFGMLLDENESAAVVHAAIDAGITYYDTADAYGAGRSEEFLGRALGARRDEVVIATKFGAAGMVPDGMRPGSPQWVRRAVDASLQRLATDRIDHFQLHYPDPDTPLEETLSALDDLVRAGKVRELGSSNLSAAQIDAGAAWSATEGRAGFRSVQNRYSVLHRAVEHDGVLDSCRVNGVVFVPYFPLELGILTGKYRPGQAAPDDSRLARWDPKLAARFSDDAKIAAAARLEVFCRDRGRTLVELAFSWLAAESLVASVIAGATRPEQVRMNASAAGWVLTKEDLAEIDRLVAGDAP